MGRNIVPTEVSDCELSTSTSAYGGMIATHSGEEDVEEIEKDMRGGTKYVRIWYDIILQCFWLGTLLRACWSTQSGSIFVWWCQVG